MLIIKLRQTHQHNIHKKRKWRPVTSEVIKKCGNYKRDKLHRRNHETFEGYGEQLKIQLDSMLLNRESC